MQDFRKYSYTIKLEDLQKTIREAINGGLAPLVIINGECYSISAPEADKATETAGKESKTCLKEEQPF